MGKKTKLAINKDTIKNLKVKTEVKTGAGSTLEQSAQNCSKQVLTYTCPGGYTCTPIIGTVK